MFRGAGADYGAAGSISVSIRNGRMEVTIPANMTTEIYLPGRNEPAATVGSGRHTFKYLRKLYSTVLY